MESLNIDNTSIQDENEILKVSPFNKNNKLITEIEVINLLKTYGVEEEINNLRNYQLAFIHKSYVKKENNINNRGESVELAECPEDCLNLQDQCNERLEFLGDSILGSTVASYLYERFPDENEGFMTRLRTKLVNGEMLGFLAQKVGFPEFMIISKHVEEKCNGRENVRILEDIFESFIGSLYLDLNDTELKNPKMEFFSGIGFQVCQVFIINIIEKFVDFSELILNDYNYKDQLLRYFQHKFKQVPKYRQISVEGLHHNRLFTMAVVKDEKEIIAYGQDKSKKKAEQQASLNALIKYGIIES